MHAMLVVAALIVAAETSPLAGYDVFGRVLSPAQRMQISRDARCAPAKAAVDAFAESKDPHDGITALNDLEGCALMSRVGDWTGYRDYLLTAAGAIAYEVGILAGEPKAYERALKDLSYVNGYRAPKTATLIVVSARNDEIQPTSGLGALQFREMNVGMPQENSVHNQRQTTKVTGYAGAYGELATEVGDAALQALEQRRSLPQSRSAAADSGQK